LTISPRLRLLFSTSHQRLLSCGENIIYRDVEYTNGYADGTNEPVSAISRVPDGGGSVFGDESLNGSLKGFLCGEDEEHGVEPVKGDEDRIVSVEKSTNAVRRRRS
jgi:hypothetical protein